MSSLTSRPYLIAQSSHSVYDAAAQSHLCHFDRPSGWNSGIERCKLASLEKGGLLFLISRSLSTTLAASGHRENEFGRSGAKVPASITHANNGRFGRKHYRHHDRSGRKKLCRTVRDRGGIDHHQMIVGCFQQFHLVVSNLFRV